MGVTGSVPARARQESLVQRWLPIVEVATVAAIGVIAGLAFRSLVAPLAILAWVPTGAGNLVRAAFCCSVTHV